ncbi:MAG: OmpH family outer membrane protein [Gammaproteobacteria bacterium]|nr:OmpH family outer membrane protein [Gammaproteobacteria bacterium]
MMLVFAAAVFTEADAQTLPDTRIAIVDFQLIQKNSTAMVDIQKQIEDRRLFYQEQISAQERDLRANDQELTRQRSVLSAEAFALKRREFEAKVAQVQRAVQDRKRELDQAFEYGTNQVQLVINDIVAELSKQKNFNIVLSRQQIVFAENSLNISEEIIQILNERLPLVEVPLAQN